MTTKTMRVILFGNFSFGDFVKGKDRFPCAIVHKVLDQRVMSEDEADDFMMEHHYDGYLIPSIFQGEIYHSKEDASCLK